jgi:DNA mismatch endonuclease (patch repair protein)
MERLLKSKLKDGRFANVSPERFRIMSAIRSKSNKSTEVRMRMALVRARVTGWTLNPPDILGHPDIYFREARIAVFLDGCYWHGCRRCGHIPKTNRSFWAAKIARNRKRDSATTKRLRESGMTVIRIWEHELRAALRSCVAMIASAEGLVPPPSL